MHSAASSSTNLSPCPYSGHEGRPSLPDLTFPAVSFLSLHEEAQAFFELYARETDQKPDWLSQRMGEVCREIARSGTYVQTFDEIEYGAKLCWRNSARCVGRLFWENLVVVDHRNAQTAAEIAQGCFAHIVAATNGGKLLPMLTFFAPALPGKSGPRIWNTQLIRYAGYRQADGTILGDPLEAPFTEQALRMGWDLPEAERTAFDILPLIIEMPGEAPQLFPFPPGIVLEVPILHPDYPWFAEWNLKWHALPAISHMQTVIGGISYPAAPFSGWYVGYEIGARNLADSNRYNLLPRIADRMGLSRKGNKTFWRDRALVELNVAVLHSFEAADVKIVDHHTATRQFVIHQEREAEAGRITPAEWSWIVPPLSGSQTPVYHQAFENTVLKPNFFPQPAPFSPHSAPQKAHS